MARMKRSEALRTSRAATESMAGALCRALAKFGARDPQYLRMIERVRDDGADMVARIDARLRAIESGDDPDDELSDDLAADVLALIVSDNWGL